MRLLIVGAGGHAKVVIDAARAAGHDVVGVVDDSGHAAQVLGVRVGQRPSDFDADAFVVAIGDNAARASIFADYVEEGLVPQSVVHPATTLAEGTVVGVGTVVAAGVTVNVDACIGSNVILNTGCTVDHDCVVGDHAHVGPGANLCGGVHVGEGALIGVGACAIPRSNIGDWAVIGAGSAITADVPAASTWGGVPARPIVRSPKDIDE